ncbi:MAG: hypothetical protein IJU12_04515, partial [Clostridia bacterium]|nr:hypothetical protein [Clostridia bacterium]
MRKIYALLLILALLFAALPASADSYQFGKLFMLVDIPLDEYLVQITPQTVNQYADFLATIGHTPESMLDYFNQDGVLVWAYDEADGRTLVITAVQDAPAKEYYDINEQTPATRATYR